METIKMQVLLIHPATQSNTGPGHVGFGDSEIAVFLLELKQERNVHLQLRLSIRRPAPKVKSNGFKSGNPLGCHFRTFAILKKIVLSSLRVAPPPKQQFVLFDDNNVVLWHAAVVMLLFEFLQQMHHKIVLCLSVIPSKSHTIEHGNMFFRNSFLFETLGLISLCFAPFRQIWILESFNDAGSSFCSKVAQLMKHAEPFLVPVFFRWLATATVSTASTTTPSTTKKPGGASVEFPTLAPVRSSFVLAAGRGRHSSSRP